MPPVLKQEDFYQVWQIKRGERGQKENRKEIYMKKFLNILYRLYKKFRNTCGEFDMFRKPEHRTKSKPIKLYRVSKMPGTIEIYEEFQIGKTLYRVTSVFTGEIDLKSTLEDLIVKRVLQSGEKYGKTKY
jgi:hypothetical protein